MALEAAGRNDVAWNWAFKVWPWLSEGEARALDTIWTKFDKEVMLDHTMTIDQLIDWTRDHEPAEQAPPSEQKAAGGLEHESCSSQAADPSGRSLPTDPCLVCGHGPERHAPHLGCEVG